MAVDMFIKLDGIKGESIDSVHKGEVDILAWSWGASQSSSFHVGGGGGAGKVNIQDLSLTKYVDRSSPTLFNFCCKGAHIKTADITVRKAGGKTLEYIKISLIDVIVSSWTTGGSGGEDKLTENISLSFAKVKFTYTPQKEDGTSDAAVPVTWNIPGNTESIT
jgi:type VI secretion system secreted protein Hcp